MKSEKYCMKLIMTLLLMAMLLVNISYSKQQDTAAQKSSSSEPFSLSPLFKQILDLYKKALEAYVKGDYPTAIVNAQDALLLDPLQQESFILLKQAKAKIGINESKDNTPGDALNSEEQKKLFLRGMQHYLLKEYHDAKRHWELLKTINPKYPDINNYISQAKNEIIVADSIANLSARGFKYFEKALNAYQKNDKGKTLQYIDTALSIYPQQSEALMLRTRISNETKSEYDRIMEYGKSLYASGAYQKAVEVWKSGLGLSGGSNELQSLIAETEKQVGEMKTFFMSEGQSAMNRNDLYNALVNYEKAFDITPDDRDIDGKIKTIHEKLDSERNRLFKIATEDYTKGDIAKSLEGFRMVLQIAPEYAPAKEYSRLCTERLQKIQKDETIAQNRKKAKDMESQDNINEAQYYWNQVLNLSQTDSEASEAIKRLGKKAEAKQKNITVNMIYGRSMDLYRNGKYQDARELWKQIQEKDPDNAQIRQMLSELEDRKQSLIQKGDEFAGKGEYALAVKEYSDALRTDPSNVAIKQKIANAEKKQKELEEQNSNAAAAKKIQVSSKEIEDLISKGLEYYMSQQFDKALDTWNRILEKDPNNSRVHSYINNLKNKMKKLDQL